MRLLPRGSHFEMLHRVRDVNLLAIDSRKIGMQFERKTIFKGFPALVFAISREQWLANRAA